MGRGSSDRRSDLHRAGRRRRRSSARRRGSPRRRSGVRGALLALPPPHPRLRDGHGQGPRPRGGHHPGGLRLRAAPDARDRAADRVQAVDLRDRQERVHRPVPALASARRRSRSQAEDGLAPADYGRLVGSDPAPDDAVAAKQELDNLCGAFGGLSDTHHEILVHARARGPLLPRDRRAHGHEPPGRGEHAVPRPPAADRGVRRAGQRRALPADPEPDRDRRRERAWARASRAGSRATSPTASRAAARRMAAGLDSAILTHVPLRKRAAAEGRRPAAVPDLRALARRRRRRGCSGHARERRAGLDGARADAVRSALGRMGQARDGGRRLVARVGAAGVGTKVAGGHDAAPAPRRAAAEGAAAPAALRADEDRAARWARRPSPRRRRPERRSAAARRRAAAPTRSGGTQNAGGGERARRGRSRQRRRLQRGRRRPRGGGGGGTKLPAVKLPAAGGDPVAPVTEAVDDVVRDRRAGRQRRHRHRSERRRAGHRTPSIEVGDDVGRRDRRDRSCLPLPDARNRTWLPSSG